MDEALKIGDLAPDFEAPTDEGETIRLSDFRGKRVVLYFYPKDDTSGCTKQACGFRDRYPEIEERNAVVLGVSPDGVRSHDKFKLKYDLPFALLSDADHQVADTYGAWGEKKSFGRTYMGIIRSTFIIDEEGMIMKVFPRVRPKNHSQEVLDALSLVMRMEGLVPALESAHAFAMAFKEINDLSRDDIILINQSGRGDKDIFTIADAFADPKWQEFIRRKAEEYRA